MHSFSSRTLAILTVLLLIALAAVPALAQEKTQRKKGEKKPATPTAKPSPAPPARASSEPMIRVRVEGQAGYTMFAAKQSFNAVLGTSKGVSYGGGAGVLIGRHLFVDVEVSRFRHSGERVFLGANQQRFSLGIPLESEVLPIEVSAGWRFIGRPPLGTLARAAYRPRVVPFAGGGIGIVKYKETSKFAEAGDDVNDRFTSYHVGGGVEFSVSRHVGVIGEGLYRWVPDALGTAGVSKAFGETDLGGGAIRVRGVFTF
jgi:opacity protein-like surface antigen